MKKRNVPLYGFRIYFCNDKDDLKKFLTSHRSDIDVDNYAGAWLEVNGKDGMVHKILSVLDGSVGTLAHEAVHAAWHLLDNAEVSVSFKNQEALAYLVDWMVTTYLKLFPQEDVCVTPMEHQEAKSPIALAVSARSSIMDTAKAVAG